jgi:phage shock protein C
MPTRLERSQKDKMIAGVCGGIAEYLQVEVTWIRLVFVLLAIFGGIGVLAYIVLAILMPLPGQRSPQPGATTVASDATERLPGAAAEPAPPVDTERRREAAGYALIAIGAIFLLGNQGLFRFLDWREVWPLALVAAGVLLLVQRVRR